MGGGSLPLILDAETKEKCDRVYKTAGMKRQDMSPMFKAFRKMDKEHTGMVSMEAFYNWLGVKKSLFYERTWELIDLDYNDLMTSGISWTNFLQFVITFCCFSELELLKFLFFLYDRSKVGKIDKNEFRSMILAMNAEAISSTDEIALEGLEAMDTVRDDSITFNEMCQLNKQFPHLLNHIFVLQNSLALLTNGIDWWQRQRMKCAEARLKLLGHGEHLRYIEAKKMLFEREKLLIKKLGRRKTKVYMWKFKKYQRGLRIFKVFTTEERLLPAVDCGMNAIPERLIMQMAEAKKKLEMDEAKQQRAEAQKSNDERRTRSMQRKKQRQKKHEFDTSLNSTESAAADSSESKKRRKRRTPTLNSAKVIPEEETPTGDGVTQVQVLEKKKQANRHEEPLVLDDL